MSEVKCWFDKIAMEKVVAKRDFDAQRLRADTAEATVVERDKALALKHRDLIEAQTAVTGWARKHAAAEQRIAQHEGMLRHFASCAEVFQVGTSAMDYVAALNPKPKGHYSDCSTNNRGVPELLGPCDCGYEGEPK